MSTMGSSESKDNRPHTTTVGDNNNNNNNNNNGGANYTVAGDVASNVGSQQSVIVPTESSYHSSVGTTGGWIAETDQRIIASNLVPAGYSTAPNVPAGEITRGCEPCVHPPKGPTGMKLFQAMRREWRTRTLSPPPAPTIDDVDPDDIADAIEETPGDFLEPPVHLPVMLDILIDIWEDSGLYD